MTVNVPPPKFRTAPASQKKAPTELRPAVRSSVPLAARTVVPLLTIHCKELVPAPPLLRSVPLRLQVRNAPELSYCEYTLSSRSSTAPVSTVTVPKPARIRPLPLQELEP